MATTTTAYTISKELLKPGYATKSEALLVNTNEDGLVSIAPPISVTAVKRFIRSTNVPVFEVWRVPPGNLADGSTTVLTAWRSDRPPGSEKAPLPAYVLNHYDRSGGAFNLATGVLTIPKSGIYRHSLGLKVRNASGSAAIGIHVRVNGVRTLGDSHRNTGDDGFRDHYSFTTEMWHDAQDQVAFQVSTSGGSSEGIFARWVVLRAAEELNQ
jgi:hypothetical protein